MRYVMIQLILLTLFFLSLTYAQERGQGKYSGMKFSSNGERIYYTGISERSGVISFQDGPAWLSMHGGSCVNCHGVSGRGGVQVMMGTAIPADIRYMSLTEEKHDHHEHGTGHNHVRYTDELFNRAVRQGIGSSGKPLDGTMPRFMMTDEDINDVIGFLKTLK